MPFGADLSGPLIKCVQLGLHTPYHACMLLEEEEEEEEEEALACTVAAHAS